jgi:hypothetical protein
MALTTVKNSGLSGSIDLTSKVTGALPVGNGGTGISSGTSGQYLKFTGSTTVASAAVDAGKIKNIHKKKVTSNGIYSTAGTYISFGSDYGFDISYTASSMIMLGCSGMMQSNNYGHTATHAGHSAFKWFSTTGSIPAEGSAPGGSDTMINYTEWGLENMFDVANKNFGIYGILNLGAYDLPAGTAVKYYLAGSSNRTTTTMEVYGTASQPFYLWAIEYDVS